MRTERGCCQCRPRLRSQPTCAYYTSLLYYDTAILYYYPIVHYTKILPYTTILLDYSTPSRPPTPACAPAPQLRPCVNTSILLFYYDNLKPLLFSYPQLSHCVTKMNTNLGFSAHIPGMGRQPVLCV